jgi:hypothetical protein
MTRREKLKQIVTILSHPAASSGRSEARAQSRKVLLHVN